MAISKPGKLGLGLLGVIMVAAALAGLAWHYLASWTPSRDDYPVQGLSVGNADGRIGWPTIVAMGADFAYIHASSGADERDRRFAENIAGAAQAGIGFGAIHDFSLCDTASAQAANFVTTVPRIPDMLAPAVSLDFSEGCSERPDRSKLLSELNIFLNQIESHSGKPAILRISPQFEDRYGISQGIARPVWLVRDYFAPEYAAKPWAIWQANARYSIMGAQGPVRWSVVKP